MLLNELFDLYFKIYMGQCATRQNQSSSKSNKSTTIYTPKIKDFIFLQIIGKGGFSKVWKVQEKQTQRIYALKVMDKAKIIAKKSRNILSSLHSSNSGQIAKLRAAFQDKQNLYLLLDYFEGHSLREHLNRGMRLDQPQIKFFISQLLDALQCLYEHNIIHGDIKPENILFDKQGRPFLADFGTASYLVQDNSSNNSGTIGYMAPQVMQFQSHTFTADYYAVGIIAYELFFGRLPYGKQTVAELLKQINKKAVCRQNFPELDNILPEASNFMIKLLERKQHLRLGFQGGIQELINHPWLRIISEGSIPQIQSMTEKQPRCHKYYNSTETPYNHSLSKQQIRKILQRDQVQQMFKSYDYLPDQFPQQLRKIQTMVANDEPARFVLKHCISI